MVKWIVRGCFAVCVSASVWAMAVGDGAQFVVGGICLFVSCLVYIPMLEELE